MIQQQYEPIGVVTHYFDRISVAVVQLSGEIYLEDWIWICGMRTNFEQRVDSLQINRHHIDKGEPGEQVALKVDAPVRDGDQVYLIMGEPPEKSD
jgi:hypothetical protein